MYACLHEFCKIVFQDDFVMVQPYGQDFLYIKTKGTQLFEINCNNGQCYQMAQHDGF